MQGYAKPTPARPRGHAQLHGACPQSPAVLADEYSHLGRFCQRRALPQPSLERLHGFFSDGDDARLLALAKHADCAVLQVEVRKIKADELGKSQPGGIQKLKQSMVARE